MCANSISLLAALAGNNCLHLCSFKLFLFVTQVLIQNYLSAIILIPTFLLTFFFPVLPTVFCLSALFSHHLKAISLFETVTLPAEQMQASHESSEECSMAASGASL